MGQKEKCSYNYTVLSQFPLGQICSIRTVPKPVITYYATEQHDYCVLGTCSTCENSAGISFTERPKISIFAPQLRLVALAPIHVKFGVCRSA